MKSKTLKKTVGLCPTPCKPLKRLDLNFYQNAITLHFSEQNYKLSIKFYFYQILLNKIQSAKLLAFHFLEGVNVPFRPNNHKSCIRCQKLCKACFRRHMECAVLKRFLKVQETFSIKKFLQIPLYHLGKIKFNPFYQNFD